MSLVKLKGPIEKEDPNAVRKKLSPKSLEQIEKRASEDSGKGNVITEFGDETVEEDQPPPSSMLLVPIYTPG